MPGAAPPCPLACSKLQLHFPKSHEIRFREKSFYPSILCVALQLYLCELVALLGMQEASQKESQ